MLFGLRCRFTEAFVAKFVEYGHDVHGILVPGPPRLVKPIRTSPNRPVLPMAGAGTDGFGDLPVYRVGRLTSNTTVELMQSLQPDAIVVACFHRRIPQAIIDTATLTAVNVHPSLLPDNRGPDPLFWEFKRGDGRFGVTIHELAPEFDAGPILAQTAFEGWDGITEAEAEVRLARHGARLCASALEDVAAGRPTRLEQDARRATYQTWPTEDDYWIEPGRPASAAFNFVRGVKERGVPIRAIVGHREYRIEDVLGYDARMEPDGISHDPDIVPIACTPGVLLARVARDLQ